jgi:UDP-N-acetylmuramyl pentapeptide phosphotransferase/UDP-N-acetylglucosamine-1-phosphate transferase
MVEFSPALFVLIVFSASWLATGAILLIAHRRSFLAVPNERSSHSIPTPFGGGIAIVLALVAAWLFFGMNDSSDLTHINYVIMVTGGLAILSFVDDIRELPVNFRLAVQIAAIAFILSTIPAPISFFGGYLSPAWDNIMAGLIWLWFINLFNFMDGIDGIAGVELISLGGGVAIIASLVSLTPMYFWLSLTIFAATLGFLWWNWQPAKIFLGDAGSIPLGFFLGWLLLMLAAKGQGAAAIILPLYYLTDATVTLIKRAVRKEKIWHAHKEHFYQRAVQRGLSHRHVSIVVMIANAGLIGCAVLSTIYPPWLPLHGAVIITALLLLYLKNQTPSMFGRSS